MLGNISNQRAERFLITSLIPSKPAQLVTPSLRYHITPAHKQLQQLIVICSSTDRRIYTPRSPTNSHLPRIQASRNNRRHAQLQITENSIRDLEHRQNGARPDHAGHSSQEDIWRQSARGCKSIYHTVRRSATPISMDRRN